MNIWQLIALDYHVQNTARNHAASVAARIDADARARDAEREVRQQVAPGGYTYYERQASRISAEELKKREAEEAGLKRELPDC
jgi:hypothetical protein